MGLRDISRIWMPIIGILFCVVEGKSENNLLFEADRIVSAGIEMPYRVAHTNGMGNQVLVIYLHGGSSKGNDNDTQMKHEVTCIQSYTTDRLNWIFSHSRNSSGIVNPTKGDKTVVTELIYSLDGRSLSEVPCKGFYIKRLIYNDSTAASFKVLK